MQNKSGKQYVLVVVFMVSGTPTFLIMKPLDSPGLQEERVMQTKQSAAEIGNEGILFVPGHNHIAYPQLTPYPVIISTPKAIPNMKSVAQSEPYYP